MRHIKAKDRRAYQSMMHQDILQERKQQNCKCPYCGGTMTIKPVGYIKTAYNHEHMVCQNYPSCDTYCRVTKYKGQYELLSSPANKELRRMRHEAHFWLNKLIETGVCKTKMDTYFIISQRVSVQNGKMLHIGQCREFTCSEIITACIEVLYNNRLRFNQFEGWYGSSVRNSRIDEMRRAISYCPRQAKGE